MTGIILAGGHSKRLGKDKAFITIGNSRVIEGIVNKLSAIFTDVIIVTKSPETYKYLGAKLVRDLMPESGSLIGIYSGLVSSNNDYNFIVGCDMPFLNISLIKYMMIL